MHGDPSSSPYIRNTILISLHKNKHKTALDRITHPITINYESPSSAPFHLASTLIQRGVAGTVKGGEENSPFAGAYMPATRSEGRVYTWPVGGGKVSERGVGDPEMRL